MSSLIDPILAAAFIDGQPRGGWSGTRVLGVRLRKFCRWHLLLLLAVNSPFVRKGAVTLFDLRTAVAICRLRFDDSRLRRPWLVPFVLRMKMWSHGVMESWSDGAMQHPNTPPLHHSTPIPTPAPCFQRVVDAFLEYTGDYLQKLDCSIIPPELPKGAVPRVPATPPPDIFDAVSDIIGWSHWPEAVAWELPIGREDWYRTSARRAQGMTVDFMDEEEREFQQKLKERGALVEGTASPFVESPDASRLRRHS